LYLEAVDRLDAPLQHKLCDLIRRRSGAAEESAGKTPRKIAVFSTSTRPLHGCMADGSVRPELGALLDTVSVHIPPLRRSPERIGPLVDYFLRKGAAPGRRQILFSPTALQLASLQAYPWPGNVKELHALVCAARRLADWDAAIGRLQNGTAAPPPHGPVDWSTDGIALMPDFEIRSRRMLDELTTSLQSDEMGLMDLVFYEEVLAGPKRS
jgi:DNA-binding NtrC family response regulator